MAMERSEPRPETELEEALNSWLREELGIEEPRRVVRSNERRIVVSKVDAELAPDLFQLVELTPELFDPARVDAAYRERVVRVDPATSRAENWRAAMQDRFGQDAGLRHRGAGVGALEPPEPRRELDAPRGRARGFSRVPLAHGSRARSLQALLRPLRRPPSGEPLPRSRPRTRAARARVAGLHGNCRALRLVAAATSPDATA